MRKAAVKELRQIANELGLSPLEWRKFKKGYLTIPLNERRASLDTLRTRVHAKKKEAKENYDAESGHLSES